MTNKNKSYKKTREDFLLFRQGVIHEVQRHEDKNRVTPEEVIRLFIISELAESDYDTEHIIDIEVLNTDEDRFTALIAVANREQIAAGVFENEYLPPKQLLINTGRCFIAPDTSLSLDSIAYDMTVIAGKDTEPGTMYVVQFNFEHKLPVVEFVDGDNTEEESESSEVKEQDRTEDEE